MSSLRMCFRTSVHSSLTAASTAFLSELPLPSTSLPVAHLARVFGLTTAMGTFLAVSDEKIPHHSAARSHWSPYCEPYDGPSRTARSMASAPRHVPGLLAIASMMARL